jgi:hypothetical protein
MEQREREPDTGNPSVRFGEVGGGASPHLYSMSNSLEAKWNLNATNNDTDGDGIPDGIEFRGGADTNHNGHIDANDTDSDGDGIPDGLEDKNHNGIVDPGETDRLRNDTDGDGLLDGEEDANHNGIRDAPGGVYNESSPLMRDGDGDGITDYEEVKGTWCYLGETGSCGSSPNSARYTNASNPDTDGDGISDGLEIRAPGAIYALYVAGQYTEAGVTSSTNPANPDTDGDGLWDGVEDANRNGHKERNETDPMLADTDKDGLCDGNCSGYGEDLNFNGYRDQNGDGNWTETDPLANDSDVDGISDGKEVFGSWCNATETAQQCSGAPNAARVLQPLNPDTDGDGLRDGQEIAGWKVLVWREITMEVMATYNVTSDPLQQNTDGDNNSDFVEFQNGSDPWKADTDGDGLDDTFESQRGENVTGFLMSPPRFQAIFLAPTGGYTDIAIAKECRGGALSLVGCTPYAKVAFQVWSHWGIDYWEVNYGKPRLNETEEAAVVNITGMSSANASLVCMFGDATSALISKEKCDRVAEIWGRANIGGQTISGNGGGQNELNVSVEFQMTTDEDHFNGPWIQARVFDAYGAGAQKTLKLKSSMEKLVDFLAAVAKAIAEAASFLAKIFIAIVQAMVSPLRGMMEQGSEGFARDLSKYNSRGTPLEDNIPLIIGALFVSVLFSNGELFAIIIKAIEVIVEILAKVMPFLQPVITAISGAFRAIGAAGSAWAAVIRAVGDDVIDFAILMGVIPALVGLAIVAFSSSAGVTPQTLDLRLSGVDVAKGATMLTAAVYLSGRALQDLRWGLLGLALSFAGLAISLGKRTFDAWNVPHWVVNAVAIGLGVAGVAIGWWDLDPTDEFLSLGLLDEVLSMGFLLVNFAMAVAEG